MGKTRDLLRETLFSWVPKLLQIVTASMKLKDTLGRKAMTNLDSILKSRDITLPTKVHLIKAMVFPVVMYGSQSFSIKKVECQRIDAFELWCWRRLLRVPWTARRSNQSILKELSPVSQPAEGGPCPLCTTDPPGLHFPRDSHVPGQSPLQQVPGS